MSPRAAVTLTSAETASVPERPSVSSQESSEETQPFSLCSDPQPAAAWNCKIRCLVWRAGHRGRGRGGGRWRGGGGWLELRDAYTQSDHILNRLCEGCRRDRPEKLWFVLRSRFRRHCVRNNPPPPPPLNPPPKPPKLPSVFIGFCECHWTVSVSRWMTHPPPPPKRNRGRGDGVRGDGRGDSDVWTRVWR